MVVVEYVDSGKALSEVVDLIKVNKPSLKVILGKESGASIFIEFDDKTPPTDADLADINGFLKKDSDPENTPIGGCIVWLKNSANPFISNKWVECNGQVLVDKESPMNGQTIPNQSDFPSVPGIWICRVK